MYERLFAPCVSTNSDCMIDGIGLRRNVHLWSWFCSLYVVCCLLYIRERTDERT